MPGAKRGALALAACLVTAHPAAADVPYRHAARRLVVHLGSTRHFASPVGVAVAPGLVFETPFSLVAGTPATLVRVPHYLGPDGAYDSQADLVRSIDGTPCGQACTRRSLERWGYAPVDD